VCDALAHSPTGSGAAVILGRLSSQTVLIARAVWVVSPGPPTMRRVLGTPHGVEPELVPRDR
jgi:hypothetical protein